MAEEPFVHPIWQGPVVMQRTQTEEAKIIHKFLSDILTGDKDVIIVTRDKNNPENLQFKIFNHEDSHHFRWD